MADDIVTQMKMRPDWASSELPVGDPGMGAKALDMFFGGSVVRNIMNTEPVTEAELFAIPSPTQGNVRGAVRDLGQQALPVLEAGTRSALGAPAMTPQEQQGIRQLGGKIAETGTELGLYGGVGGLMMGAASAGIRAGSPSWMKGRIVPEARESVWRGIAKSRAKVTKEDWRQIYGGLKEMEMKIPEWVLKQQKWEAGTMAENIRATHTAPSIKLGKIPGQRGGTIRLNVLGSMDDFKEFIYSGYHEGGGHGVTTMLKNYVNSTPQHPVLKNRINNMFRVHSRAQKNEKALRLVSKSLQDQALTQDVARSAILEKAASNLENLAHRIYLSSPDELLSRGMKAALKRGEDFQTVFKRKMLNAIKTTERQNEIITRLTDQANKIINSTKTSQSAKVLAKRYNLTPAASASKTRLPQLKGALGRETLEKKLGDALWKKGYPKEVIANIQSTLQHATIDDLKKLLGRFKGGK